MRFLSTNPGASLIVLAILGLGLLYGISSLTYNTQILENLSSIRNWASNGNVGCPAEACPNGPRDDVLRTIKQQHLKSWNLEELVGGELPNDDPKLLALVRQLLDPPSTFGRMTVPRHLFTTPQAKEVMNIFKDDKAKKQDHFYVECGALDGERSSNTIALEKEGWTGLLIEADSYMYTQLLGKNRRAWSINACLSPTNKTQLMFFEARDGMGHLVSKKPSGTPSKQLLTVPCFTLETLMLALNRSRLDYFSLDVEGVELDVLKTVPFNKLDIRSLTVEYVHVNGGIPAIKDFLAKQKFTFLKQIDVVIHDISLWAHDLMFVK